MTVIVATITCDFKAYSLPQLLKSISKLGLVGRDEQDVKVFPVRRYLNIETDDPARYKWLVGEGWGDWVWIDFWQWSNEWIPTRDHDQAQGARLPRICVARNMAMEFARHHRDCTHLLFIDSDVLVPPDTIPRLMAHNKDIVGGSVPGRGAHASAVYHGSGSHHQLVDGLLEVDYGTAGFVMLSRRVFTAMAWRWGHTEEGTGPHSEDPIFAHDARLHGFGWWYIDRSLAAKHVDRPDEPLTEEGAAEF